MHTYGRVNLGNASVQKVLSAAAACFGRKGYHGVSMQEIANDAGVSKSLLHYHFASKEHLFLEVQLELCRQLVSYVRGVVALKNASHERVDAALDEVMTFLEHDLDHILAMFELFSVSRDNPLTLKHQQDFQAEVLALIEDGLTNVLGPMTDRLVIPTSRVARLLMTIFNGLIVDLALARANADARIRVRETFADVRALITSSLFAELS